MTERVRLGEIVDVASGQVDPRSEPYCDMLHVGGDNIESGTGRLFGMRPARDLNLISGKYQFGHKDVLYSKIRPALNKVALPDFSGICSADMYPLRPREGRVERRYLAHLLRHSDFLAYAGKHSSRTNIPKINREALLSYEVALPSLGEQERIADILDKADSIRSKRKQAISLTEELLRSTFLEMFGDPLMKPNGWPVRQLGDVSEVAGGLQVTRARANNPIVMPYLRVANVYRDRLDLSEIKEIRVTDAERRRASLRRGDVLVVEGHGNPEELGRAAVWGGEIADCTHQNHLIRVRSRADVLDATFLSAFLNSSSGRRQMLKLGKTTSGLNTISTNNVRSVQIFVPPFERQVAYAEVVTRVRKLNGNMQESSAEEDNLFSSLVAGAFSASVEAAC